MTSTTLRKSEISMFTIVNKMMHSALSGRALSTTASYEDAIRTLNGLQSNAAYISAARKHVSRDNNTLRETKKYLLRSGISLEQLDHLNVIHVAGTKGKGSTCAFTEAILREHGFRTGFYSSPHLITVCERFRINGQPISESDFTYHFWKLYNALLEKKSNESDMPQYFKFLTVMMFQVFLEAKVDVAIVEVGIGGEYDCTNIIANPVCVGITSLGLDHTSLLGNTIEEIAYQKSGIFKPNVPAFTVPQLNNSMKVLESRAIEKKCNLSVVPRVHNYKWKSGMPPLGIQCSIQEYNASLAIQLAQTWIMKTQKENDCQDPLSDKCIRLKSSIEHKKHILETRNVNIEKENKPKSINGLNMEKVIKAISSCRWPGRTQILSGKTVNFYIDGAHTSESIECCAAWFAEKTAHVPGKRYLIFNATGDRDSEVLLRPLKNLRFDMSYFVPNVAGVVKRIDQMNFNCTVDQQMAKCLEHSKVWGGNFTIANNVAEALNDILKKKLHDEPKPLVLVTGSLHLAGAALSILDPDLSMTTTF